MEDETYLLDMLTAAREAVEFVSDLDEQQFAESRLHQMAVVKQLEIIGEAANRISKPFRDSLAMIPWPLIIGMRHRLVHDYTHIDVATVWETVTGDLTSLISTLTPLIPPDIASDD